MARLTARLVTDDDSFLREVTARLRGAATSVRIVDDAVIDGPAADLVVIDVRGNRHAAVTSIERARTLSSAAGIIVVAGQMDPDLILDTMRAGANEFLTWPLADDVFRDALRRTDVRREASAVARPRCSTLVFLGAKGGVGTTTLAVNSASEIARVSKRPTLIIDLQAFMGEVSLFLGVRPRFTVNDALDNIHRIDAAFLRELVARHKAGLDILAAGDQVDRPGATDAERLERLLPVLSEHYEYIVIDAGRVTAPCAEIACYAADTTYVVANPDVPSIRNTQRVIDRLTQLGIVRDRVRVLLNRSSAQHLIAPKQIESALGHTIHQAFSSDYGTVATALNSGVPLTLTNHSELASQFNRFTRDILGMPAGPVVEAERRRGILLGLF